MATQAEHEPTEREVMTMRVVTPKGRVVWYPPTAILTREEVAEVLDVDPITVRRWQIRCAFPSPRHPRYLFKDVVDFLDKKAA